MDTGEIIDRLCSIADELDDLSLLHATNCTEADDAAAALMRITSASLELDANHLRRISSYLQEPL